MKIAIDVREAFRPRVTGKGQWLRGFLRELRTRPDLDIVCVSDSPLPSEYPQTIISGSGFAWHFAVARWLRTQKPADLYLSPTSYLVPFIAGKFFPCVPVIHDLIAFRGEPHDRKAQLIERLTLKRAVTNARHVLTISDASKTDLLSRVPSLDPQKVTAIGAGPMHDAPEKNVSDGKTIVCIGTLCPRKNQLRLLQAYASLPDNLRSKYSIILAGGRGWHDDEIVKLAASTPGAKWIGYIDDETYNRLLNTCHVFALPSLYEGFGLQILDALQRGACVLTSDRGSLKEVAGEAALMVNPGSMDDIAKGLERLLTDDAMRASLRARGPQQAATFTWKNTVDRFVRVLQKIG